MVYDKYFFYIQTPVTKYYFDKYGRYIHRDGKKVYQCAPCTSLYRLEDNDLLTKLEENKDINDTKETEGDVDAGPSLKEFQCRKEIKNPNHVVVLPNVDPVNITSKSPVESY